MEILGRQQETIASRKRLNPRMSEGIGRHERMSLSLHFRYRSFGARDPAKTRERD